MATERMLDRSEGMTRFLGVAADSRLLEQDRFNLPAAEQSLEPPIVRHEHDRLVIAGSTLTGVSLVAGMLLLLYGGSQVLFNGGGVVDLVLAVLGILLAATHWGWVHVAEYVGLTIDERHERSAEERRRDWLSSIQPYPRFSVSTVGARRCLDACRTCPAPASPDRAAHVHIRSQAGCSAALRRRRSGRGACLGRGDDAPSSAS